MRLEDCSYRCMAGQPGFAKSSNPVTNRCSLLYSVRAACEKRLWFTKRWSFP